MMTPLEIKKLKVELLRVAAARAELELRIDEHKENIERLEANIQIQLTKEGELDAKIKEADASK